MKSLRKSLNSSKDGTGSIRAQISTPLPTVGKAQSTIQPPQKVIRALGDYRPQAPQQLAFKKGDFFHVLRDVDNGGAWYEAHNPMTGARGLVPKDHFEEFNKNAAALRVLNTSGQGPQLGAPLTPQSPNPQSPKSPRTQVFYAIVQHDFFAERADELDAKRGDAITVVAQSNREWFVAKPIGRIGRPGLIPVSFVEIHDPATGRAITDVEALMDRGDLPRVEDWKRAMFNYKQNSIALGVIDAPGARQSVPNSPFITNQPPPLPSLVSPEPAISVQGPSPQDQNYSMPSNLPPQTEPELQPEGILLSANVVSFHFEMEEYWFRIDAIFQPYAAPGAALPPAKSLILFRVYNDFYDFQVSLLDTFPREAGRQPPHPRILPYMPGPAQEVDDALTATRRTELDEYVNGLCDLSNVGAKYVLEHAVVRDFLAIKPGDVENTIPARTQEMDALFGTSDQYDDGAQDVQDSFGRLAVEDRLGAYDDGLQQHPYGQADASDSSHLFAPGHQRNGSSSSLRSQSPPGTRWNEPPPMTTSPSPSSAPSTRSRSDSVANINSPSISAQNPQTAFVKIKIFDRVADDLIAIRVHPRVTHVELMDKVQSRLGGEVANLRYRDSMSNAFVGLDSDQQLRAWIDATDKHVLYAD